MFKYDLGQLIYYFMDSRICSAEILSRIIVENLREDWVATPEQVELFTPFGKARIVYSTCHGTIPEKCAFASKKELVESLMNEEE